MKRLFTVLFFVVAGQSIHAQNVYGSLTYGAMGYKCNYADLQHSYSSYLEAMEPILASNNLEFTDVDDNFSNNNLAGALTFQLGMGDDKFSFVFTAMSTKTEQTRDVRWSNGYGRSFVWKESRRETLLDLGYFGTKHFDFYGTLGLNWNWTRMVSYYIYPDETRTLTSEFAYSGVYKHYTVGLSFGAGIRYRFPNFMALECRYLFSKVGFGIINKEEDFGLSDVSITKNPDFGYFPLDYTEPISVTSGNELVPYFNRQSITLSAIFYLNMDKINDKRTAKRKEK